MADRPDYVVRSAEEPGPKLTPEAQKELDEAVEQALKRIFKEEG